ncbi:cytochrome b/b6 domain-containing protein [Tropicimonas sp. IMCC34043]|uniref:cytochrome b/b6 domain-containing protein n=1 Tax=Tropicimonas sp. IMCC34043 TaxID=2248760 RepID=UPI000E2896AE|nr:cytochrome b/b6 domain-containing protein [Tropicimonas sp. IMCC34043]
MSLRNTTSSYGAVARALHWLVALLILVLLPLGLVADQWPYATAGQLAAKAQLFSLHKTLGVTVFFLALARILWAATQPRPALLNGEKRLESTLAEAVHWLLYVCLVATPLTGWIHHAATAGFAPIWWPFGQSLPLVPKSEAVSAAFSGLHLVFVLLLVLALGLHVAGALKHHVIDRDATLRRMLRGDRAAPAHPAPRHARPAGAIVLTAIVAALGVAALGGAFAPEAQPPQTAALDDVATGWQVQEGTLGIVVRQMGSEVAGSFADWTAAIDFDETATDGTHGTAEVTIAIGSLSLGSVTSQALGADYFDAAQFPTATFRADLLPGPDGTYLAEGSLTLRGVEVPVALPFTLQIDGDTAVMAGATTLDRRTFHIGDSQAADTTLGFDVAVEIALTAHRVR